ncbi:putative uncharacterized protein MGC34800 [Meles meles]|uniref:putative uncharacterized protein MGC34800 n=1 Tax=Meles meles TaxID=9662 RepID=UPI001E6995C2|nr:putative uncharacterized protein MGC34800 [Meles meles]
MGTRRQGPAPQILRQGPPEEPHPRHGQDPFRLQPIEGARSTSIGLEASPPRPQPQRARGLPALHPAPRPGSSRAPTRPSRLPRTPLCRPCMRSRGLRASPRYTAHSLRAWRAPLL